MIKIQMTTTNHESLEYFPHEKRKARNMRGTQRGIWNHACNIEREGTSHEED